MPSNFPTSVDTFTKPTTADTLASAVHHLLHGNATDAILAIENALGTTGAPGSLLNAFLTALTAADGSVVVGGTATHPTVATGTLDAVASAHPPAADWSNNSHKITGLANGTASADAAAFGQIPAVSGTPSAVGQANAAGTAVTIPHSDHVHQGVSQLIAGTGISLSGGDGSGHGAITVAAASSGGLTLISRQVLSANAITVTFSSIPQTYENLILVVMGRCAENSSICGIGVHFNGDTGAHYDTQNLMVSGTGAPGTAISENQLTGNINGLIGQLPGFAITANAAGIIQVRIPAYARTTFWKNWIAQSYGPMQTGSAPAIYDYSGNWENTAAITQIDVYDGAAGAGQGLLPGSVISLYGES